jgi:hypothetical protein
MTWQRRVAAATQNERLACIGEPGHGDERGQDALQRLAVLLDRCVQVHRPLFLRTQQQLSSVWGGCGQMGTNFFRECQSSVWNRGGKIF